MDYLNRDSKNSGLVYGLFDMEYLIESFEVVNFPNTNQKILCIKRKALGAVEDFLFARYHHYSRIIYNQTYQYFDCIAKIVFDDLVNNKKVYDYTKVENVLLSGDDINSVIKFDDSYFFNSIIENKDNCSNKIKKLTDNILFRKESGRKINIHQKWFDKDKKEKECISLKFSCPFEEECCINKPFCNDNGSEKDFFDDVSQKHYLKNTTSISICHNKREVQEREGVAFAEDSKYPTIFSLRNPIRIKLDKPYNCYSGESLYHDGEKIIALCVFEDSIISQMSNKKLQILHNYCEY
jgi:HD superfamily phosphohydrolase